MTVRRNVEFGLKNRKLSKDKIKEQIDQFADRLPECL